MQLIDPAEFTEGVGGVEDHGNAHRATRSKRTHIANVIRYCQYTNMSDIVCSPVRPARHRQTQTTFVDVLDLLLFQTDKPLQSQTPVLGHCAVQVLVRHHREGSSFRQLQTET